MVLTLIKNESNISSNIKYFHKIDYCLFRELTAYDSPNISTSSFLKDESS